MSAAAGDVTLREATEADAAGCRELINAVLAEFDLPPAPGSTDADLAGLPLSYTDRGGRFLVAERGSELLGTLGLWPHDADTVELRKMYLKRAARGFGLGQRLLDEALSWSRPRFRVMTLETARQLSAAIALYEARGFTRYEPEALSGRCDFAYRLVLRD